MRLSVASLRRVVKSDLHIEFVSQQLTSFSGLELLGRYLRQRNLPARLRGVCGQLGGDYGGARLALLVLALLYAGGRRLDHLRHLASDPLIARFCGLARIPSAHTVANWLREFTQLTLAPLVQLNHEIVTEMLARRPLPRLTIDVDGTVSAHGRHRGLGLPWLQSVSPERSQLLSPDRPRGPDRAHPAAQKPARQRA